LNINSSNRNFITSLTYITLAIQLVALVILLWHQGYYRTVPRVVVACTFSTVQCSMHGVKNSNLLSLHIFLVPKHSPYLLLVENYSDSTRISELTKGSSSEVAQNDNKTLSVHPQAFSLSAPCREVLGLHAFHSQLALVKEPMHINNPVGARELLLHSMNPLQGLRTLERGKTYAEPLSLPLSLSPCLEPATA